MIVSVMVQSLPQEMASQPMLQVVQSGDLSQAVSSDGAPIAELHHSTDSVAHLEQEALLAGADFVGK